MEFNKVSKEIYEPVKENKKMFEENFKDKLSEIFPSTIKDGQVDFKALLEELGEYVDTKERYELTWAGKQNAKKKANEDIVGRTLKYIPEDSENPESTENLYIEGDNLEVLKLLRNSYYNKVKMIYIDPPYNTGNDFVYNDDFSQSEKETEIEEGDIFEGERFIVNQKSNGKYHSNWLNMMCPRLKIAKDLLAEDGIMFISIDDNELSNLKKVCDEIFGESNFLANIIWQKRTSPDARKKLSSSHEYILVYMKNIETSQNALNLLDLEQADINKYKNPDNDPRGSWVSTDFGAQGFRPNQMYTILTPGGKEYKPSEGRCWKNTEDGYKKLLNEGRMWFGSDGCGVPRKKLYLSEREGKNVWTWWSNKEVGHTQEATQQLTSLLGKKTIFDYPKPVKLIKRIVQIAMHKDSIMMDFFSGSATSAEAVMQLNAEDGGNRKFVMVQTDEEICGEKSEAYKAGFKNICEIGKERIRRAGEKILQENKDKEGIENLDVGFKVFKTADTNIRWFSEAMKGSLTPLEETTNDKDKLDFNDGFTDIDVVYEILLRHRDIPLSSKVENLREIGKRTYMFADVVVVCLETEITEEIVDKIAAIEPMPIKIIFRDSAFGDNISLKENTMIRLEAQIKKNSGIMKKSYRIEFI